MGQVWLHRFAGSEHHQERGEDINVGRWPGTPQQDTPRVE
jgi:hypothetical protein